MAVLIAAHAVQLPLVRHKAAVLHADAHRLHTASVALQPTKPTCPGQPRHYLGLQLQRSVGNIVAGGQLCFLQSSFELSFLFLASLLQVLLSLPKGCLGRHALLQDVEEVIEAQRVAPARQGEHLLGRELNVL